MYSEMFSASEKKFFLENGYVIVNGLIPEDQLEPLQQACDRVIEKSRKGEWKKFRAVGVQFPPWIEQAEDIWGVQHIMHPDLNEPIFAQVYCSDNLMKFVKEFLGAEENQLQLELFNLLINPVHKDFSLQWHRDDIKATVDEEEERCRLSIPHFGTQWNTALFPDNCLYVVPGSHRRVRTAEEKEIQLNDPFSDRMKGAICVPLEAGQTVFYNNNLLHRGVYTKSIKRATLHGCIGITTGGNHRARNILQHDLHWMREEKFKDSLPSRLHPLLANLITLADQSIGKQLGFSLT